MSSSVDWGIPDVIISRELQRSPLPESDQHKPNHIGGFLDPEQIKRIILIQDKSNTHNVIVYKYTFHSKHQATFCHFAFC